MLSRADWKQVHAELMAKLKLPCKLKLVEEASFIGKHEWHRSGTCSIYVCLADDWKVPAHLILHEAAHHRHNKIEEKHPCRCDDWGHCKHWAWTLCGIYKETGIPLPRTTKFIRFAEAAKIEFRENRDGERR